MKICKKMLEVTLNFPKVFYYKVDVTYNFFVIHLRRISCGQMLESIDIYSKLFLNKLTLILLAFFDFICFRQSWEVSQGLSSFT